MNQQDIEYLNKEAKMISESSLIQSQILLSLKLAYTKGQSAGIKEAGEIFNKVTGE